MSSNVYFSIPNHSDWNSLKDAQVVAEMTLTTRPQLLTPSLTYNVHGIAADKKYSARVTMNRVGDFHYRYHRELRKFIPQQCIEKELAPFVVAHRDGSQIGAHWLAHGLDFSWLTLVQKKEQVTGSTALVESRCMYQPVVRIWETDCEETFWESSTEEQQFIVVTGNIQTGFINMKNALFASKRERRAAIKRKADKEKAEEKKMLKKAKLEEIQKKKNGQEKEEKDGASVEPVTVDQENIAVPLPNEHFLTKPMEQTEQPIPANDALLQGFSYYLMLGALRLLQSTHPFGRLHPN